MNYRKKGLRQLLEMVLRGRMRRLALSDQERLLQFGAELVFTLCELQGIEGGSSPRGSNPALRRNWPRTRWRQSPFSARLYGSGSRKHRELIYALVEPLPGVTPIGERS